MNSMEKWRKIITSVLQVQVVGASSVCVATGLGAQLRHLGLDAPLQERSPKRPKLLTSLDYKEEVI